MTEKEWELTKASVNGICYMINNHNPMHKFVGNIEYCDENGEVVHVVDHTDFEEVLQTALTVLIELEEFEVCLQIQQYITKLHKLIRDTAHLPEAEELKRIDTQFSYNETS